MTTTTTAAAASVGRSLSLPKFIHRINGSWGGGGTPAATGSNNAAWGMLSQPRGNEDWATKNNAVGTTKRKPHVSPCQPTPGNCRDVTRAELDKRPAVPSILSIPNKPISTDPEEYEEEGDDCASAISEVTLMTFRAEMRKKEILMQYMRTKGEEYKKDQERIEAMLSKILPQLEGSEFVNDGKELQLSDQKKKFMSRTMSVPDFDHVHHLHLQAPPSTKAEDTEELKDGPSECEAPLNHGELAVEFGLRPLEKKFEHESKSRSFGNFSHVHNLQSQATHSTKTFEKKMPEAIQEEILEADSPPEDGELAVEFSPRSQKRMLSNNSNESSSNQPSMRQKKFSRVMSMPDFDHVHNLHLHASPPSTTKSTYNLKLPEPIQEREEYDHSESAAEQGQLTVEFGLRPVHSLDRYDNDQDTTRKVVEGSIPNNARSSADRRGSDGDNNEGWYLDSIIELKLQLAHKQSTIDELTSRCNKLSNSGGGGVVEEASLRKERRENAALRQENDDLRRQIQEMKIMLEDAMAKPPMGRSHSIGHSATTATTAASSTS
jgi:hypothetical protein